MSVLRRLDHVAMAVRDTAVALEQFSGRLGLRVVSSEDLERPPVRLTYLDCGNCYLQLVEPLDESSELAQLLRDRGEGLHHICFGVDDIDEAVHALSGATAPHGSGRGRASAFVPGQAHGVRCEVTEFRAHEDVERTPGYLGVPPPSGPDRQRDGPWREP